MVTQLRQLHKQIDKNMKDMVVLRSQVTRNGPDALLVEANPSEPFCVVRRGGRLLTVGASANGKLASLDLADAGSNPAASTPPLHQCRCFDFLHRRLFSLAAIFPLCNP